MVSFPPSIFGLRFLALLHQHFVIHVLENLVLFSSNPFLIIANPFSLFWWKWLFRCPSKMVLLIIITISVILVSLVGILT